MKKILLILSVFIFLSGCKLELFHTVEVKQIEVEKRTVQSDKAPDTNQQSSSIK